MTRGAASDKYQFTLAAPRVAKNHLWKERHIMPFTFKLSKRLARLKPRAVILALAALVACDQADRSLTSPSHPSFNTSSGNPDGVTDLAVAAASDTSITLSFTEVDDGIGAPASYDVRYVVGPSISWGSSTPSVKDGSCATPVAGTAIGSTRTCTVLGLTAGTTYSFQLVAFRGTLNVNAVFGPLSNATTGQTTAAGSSSAAGECATPQAGWIWCDDFEQNRLGQYFEYDSSSGDFVRAAGVGMDGSYGMRVHFAAGQVSAGSLHLAMGKVPDSYFRTVDAGTAIYRNVYWRMYVRNQTGWSGGGGYKLSRAISFATSTWAEAMMAHVWGDPPGSGELYLDPASGTDAAGNLLTTKYNDFANMRWLGAQSGVTPLFDASHVGQWYCVEAHAQLNDAGLSNGMFEFWINGNLEARETGLNWLGSFSAYGINALFFENYWNTGSPVAQERYFDNIVISTEPIGCVGSGPPPPPPPPPPPAPVAQVVVSPASANDTVGQKQQFTATVKDSSGNVLSGRTVTWASNNNGVATVDANGLGSGVASGTATITATSESVNGGATVTVTTPTPTVPGTVSDLTIVGSTDSSVTLSFTEVNDGTGKPASYDVRSTAGASLTWSLAKSVTQGSCATPVAGSAIGSKRTCTVLGLAAGTTYSFELVAFRGTLNVNAVFGDLSNVATGPTPARPASVTVSPSSVSDTVGQKQQFTATVKDANGNILPGPTVSWSSSNAAVATVSGSGYATAVSAGTATITATSEGVSGDATITVTAPGATTPGTVTDLAVVGSTDSSVTLSFTQVNDGTGKPASYNVRSMAGSSLTWWLAKSVTQGSCATPVAGTAIGSKRTCTVQGLAASTTYSFELVAFRGTLNVNAVFGDLSNVATGPTQAAGDPPPPPSQPGTVNDVALVGTTDSSVTLSFTEVNDGTGKPASYDVRSMAGSSLTWWLAKSVTQGSCATPVAGSAIGSKRTCTVLGLAAGTTYSFELVAFRGTLNVNAVFGDLSNVATGTTQAAGDPPPPPSQPGTNPNEPAGFQRFAENDLTVPLLDYTAATGLLGLWRAEILDSDNTYVADAAAPKSPLPVFQGKYPAGWTAGYTPIKWEGWDGAANSLGYGTEMAQMYLSLWIRFPGADYENQSVGTKFFYLGVGESKASAGNQLYTMLYHPSGAGQTIASNFPVSMEQQSAVAGVNNRTEITAAPVFSIGAWHRMEFVLQLNTIGQANGVFRWWIDGTLVMDYRDMIYVDAANPLGFFTFKFWPYWGGGGGTRTRDDYIQVDHLYLSGIPK